MLQMRPVWNYKTAAPCILTFTKLALCVMSHVPEQMLIETQADSDDLTKEGVGKMYGILVTYFTHLQPVLKMTLLLYLATFQTP